MAQNILDGRVVLNTVGGEIAFRDPSTGADLAIVRWFTSDPNGLVQGPTGSLCLTPVGLFENTDGASAWSLTGGGGSGSPWADAITSASTPAVAPTPPGINYFDRSVTIPADALEVGDVLEIVAAGEYTFLVFPGSDSASIALELGTLGFVNGNSGPVPYSGLQFVFKARATIASVGVLGTLLLFQENDIVTWLPGSPTNFALQASGVLQYVAQQTGPHNIDTTVPNTIRVRGDWAVTAGAGASMVLKTLTANIIKRVL